MITDKVGGSSAKPEVSKQSKKKRLKHKVSGYKSQSKRRSIAGCRLPLRTLLGVPVLENFHHHHSWPEWPPVRVSKDKNCVREIIINVQRLLLQHCNSNLEIIAGFSSYRCIYVVNRNKLLLIVTLFPWNLYCPTLKII